MSTDTTRPASLCPEGRYTKLPDALLSVLTPREHQLVHALLSHRWYATSLIYPRVTTLAERLGCTPRTIQRTLRRLEERGYLVTVARYRDDRGQTSNEYRPGPMLAPLLPPAEDGPVTTPRDDRRQGATFVAPKRDSGNQKKSTNDRNRGYILVSTDPSDHLRGHLAAHIRT